jgi:hypothetical protein
LAWLPMRSIGLLEVRFVATRVFADEELEGLRPTLTARRQPVGEHPNRARAGPGG